MMNYERDIVLPFITKTLPKEKWTHLAHLYTGLWHLLSYGFEESLILMRSRIILYNDATGGQNTPTGGYHETLTVFYLKELDRFILEQGPLCNSFADYCEAIHTTALGKSDYYKAFYSSQLIHSTMARSMYQVPNLV